MSDPHTKFASAVFAMATSPRPLRDRIADAYDLFHTIRTGLPEGISEQVEELHRRLRAGGTVVNTLRGASDDEAAQLAELIADIYRALDLVHHDAQRAAAVARALRAADEATIRPSSSAG